MSKLENAGFHIKYQDLDRTVRQIVNQILANQQEVNNLDDRLDNQNDWIGVMRIVFAIAGLVLTLVSVGAIFYDVLATRFLWQHSQGFGPAQIAGVFGVMGGLLFLFMAYYKWRD